MIKQHFSKTMQGVRTYLESSTIHGLSYISTTRKCSRIFWVLVVIAGFSGAGELIYDAFQSWAQSPISTTEETLPIEQLTLPKVTVCPPKNTFTDLNYDLMRAENIKDFDRGQLRDFIFDFIDDHVFMDDLNKLQEEKRFYNWYHGYSVISKLERNMNLGQMGEFQHKIETSANSGVVFTQYWGEPFNPKLVEKSINYQVRIGRPQSALNPENVVLHYEIEIVSMKGLLKVSREEYDINRVRIDEDLISDNITLSTNDIFVLGVDRNVEKENLNSQTLDTMPGFKLKWWFSNAEDNLEQKIHDDDKNLTLDFVRC